MIYVKFTYFKDTGKYYSNGEYTFEGIEYFHEAVQAIRQIFEDGMQPGLVDGTNYDCLAEIYTENGPLPHFFFRR